MPGPFRRSEWYYYTFCHYQVWGGVIFLLIVSTVRTWVNDVSPLTLWLLSSLAGVWALLSQGTNNRRDRLYASQRIEVQLALLINALEKQMPPGAKIRANIMVLDKKKENLKILWHVNMDSEAELRLLWRIGQGCVGQAYQRSGTIATDLSKYQTNSYEELIGSDGQAPWGLGKDHWQLTRHLGSVLSVPIPSSYDPTKVLGVLSIDSALELSQSRLDDSKVLEPLCNWYIPLIAKFMEEAGIKYKGGFRNGS